MYRPRTAPIFQPVRARLTYAAAAMQPQAIRDAESTDHLSPTVTGGARRAAVAPTFSMTQDVYMTRGQVHPEVADLSDRVALSEE